MLFVVVETKQIGAGKDNETEGLGRLGGTRRSKRVQSELAHFAEQQGGEARQGLICEGATKTRSSLERIAPT